MFNSKSSPSHIRPCLAHGTWTRLQVARATKAFSYAQLVSPRRGQAPLNLSQPSLHSFLILPSRGAYIVITPF